MSSTDVQSSVICTDQLFFLRRTRKLVGVDSWGNAGDGYMEHGMAMSFSVGRGRLATYSAGDMGHYSFGGHRITSSGCEGKHRAQNVGDRGHGTLICVA